MFINCCKDVWLGFPVHIGASIYSPYIYKYYIDSKTGKNVKLRDAIDVEKHAKDIFENKLNYIPEYHNTDNSGTKEFKSKIKGTFFK